MKKNYQKKRNRFLFLTAIILQWLIVFPAVAQNSITIKGIVIDELNIPLPGISVSAINSEKSVNLKTHTNNDGFFQVKTTEAGQYSFTFSSVGFQTQTLSGYNIKRGETISLSVKLLSENTTLNDVVVVGYGTNKKINLTGSVASVSGKDLADRPITSVSSGLQGLVPGMTITSAQGRPGGSNNTIRIRGTGTLNNASPYILIDGIESGSMDQIDPNDVESISVLKDAASAAIYGSKAANGVILVTTKRGTVGRSIVSYSGYAGWQAATGFIERMNSADAATYYNKSLEASGNAPRFTPEEITKFRDGSDPYGYPNTDWNKLGFDGNGFMQQHNVNLSGGAEKLKYMVSLGALDQNGIMRNSNRKQFNLRSNIDAQVSDRLSLRANMSFISNNYADPTNSYIGGGSDQIIHQLNRIAPWIPYKKQDGTYGSIGDGNPVAWLDLNQIVDTKDQNFSGILALDYKLHDDLKLTAQGAYVSNVQDRSEFIKDIQYNSIKYHGPNSLDERITLWNRPSLDLLLNYDKNFGKHNLKGLLGYHIEKYDSKYTRAYREGFANNELNNINAGTLVTQKGDGFTRELAMMSYFGRLSYDYMGKYLFEGNFRADASSRFSPDNRWGYFPSLSAGWRLSEESFMEGTRSWLQSLKIRGSWGQLGNQEALDDYYPWLVTYGIGTNYAFGGNVLTGIDQRSQKLATISWEKSNNWGIGIDFNVLSSLEFSVDYYNRKTTGIIMDVPVPGSFGLGAYKDNVGAMRNTGFEFSSTFRKKWSDWSFTAAGNMAINKNEILNLGGVNEMINDYLINRVGSAINSFYGYVADGLFKSQEEADAFTVQYGNPFGNTFQAGDFRYKDVNQDGKFNSADRAIIGSEQPKITFGLNLSGSWKDFELSVFSQGALGVYRYFSVLGEFSGDTGHPSTAWFNAWSPENPNGTFPRIAASARSNSSPNTISSFWISKANYLRVKNIQLGYNLPINWVKKAHISRAKIFYSGENLFKVDNLPFNIDPEAPSGRGSHYPQISTHAIGLNVTF